MFFGDLLLLVLIVTGVVVVSYFLNRRLLTLLVSSVFLLIVAMRLNVPYMYLMGAVLLALPLASYVIGWLGTRSLRVERRIPESAFEGEAIPVRVDIRAPLALLAHFARVNRHTPRHIRYVSASDRIVPLEDGARHEYEVRPDRRGVYRLPGAMVSVQDPLGIFVISRRYPSPSPLTVYPVGLPMQDALSMGESTGGWALRAQPRHRGEDEGFYGTREYRIGDDLRRIHWRSSARQGSLVVVERERSAGGRLWIALDVRQGSDRGGDRDSTLERSIKTAVTLMEAALQRGDTVGLIAPSPSGGVVRPAAGESQRWRILETLARVTADGEGVLSDAVLGADVDAGSTVALLTGAPTEDLVTAALRLMAAGVGVVAAPAMAAGPAQKTAYPAIDAAEFIAAVEQAGGDSLPPLSA